MKMASDKQIKKPLPSFCIYHIAGRDCSRTPVNKTPSISRTIYASKSFKKIQVDLEKMKLGGAGGGTKEFQIPTQKKANISAPKDKNRLPKR